MYSLLPSPCAVNHRFASLPCPVVLAASIDLHIDSRGKFLCNASREHLVKLSNCSWQLWVWPKNRKTEVTLLIPEWGSELLSFKGLLCCFPFSLSPLCSVLFVCLFSFSFLLLVFSTVFCSVERDLCMGCCCNHNGCLLSVLALS